MNIRGHRIGSAEVESVVLKIKEIKEVSAVGIKDSIDFEKIVLFVSLVNQKRNLKIIEKIEQKIIDNFGTYALPKNIIILDDLPKTRSGKILRRLLRSIYYNPNKKIGDISTIINKKSIDDVMEKIKKIRKS
jgi:acetyl-CoA synthetase